MFGAQQRCAVHTSGLSAKYDDGHMDLRLEQSLSLLNGRITIEDFFDGLFGPLFDCLSVFLVITNRYWLLHHPAYWKRSIKDVYEFYH